MKTQLKKPSSELIECAEALRKASVSMPTEMLKALIEEGHSHLRELESSTNCNPQLIAALEHRINHAEEALERQTRLTTDSRRRA